ncbi:MAG: CHRD domain-containing protein [Thermoleophilaceae bacterium]
MIVGTDGDDVILGSDGNDLIQGRGGNDKVCGGAGDDQAGGGPGNDQVDGGSGNDTLAGGPGDDTVLGGDGDDAMNGGTENDVCDGGAGTNTAAATGAETCETIRNANGSAGTPSKFNLAASLSSRQEVPRPRDARGAKGTFKGTLTRTPGGGELTWRLTFKGLTGRGLAAHIHRGKRGKAGAIAITLCSPCRSPKHGKAKVKGEALFRTIKEGGTYVNVHTKKNPRGEIRGQVTAVK